KPLWATLLLKLTALALERSRSMLWASLPIRTPAVPSMGSNHTESRERSLKGLFQISFWSPGRFIKTLLMVTVFSAGACSGTVSEAVFCTSAADWISPTMGSILSPCVQGLPGEHDDPLWLCQRQEPCEQEISPSPTASTIVWKVGSIRMTFKEKRP